MDVGVVQSREVLVGVDEIGKYLKMGEKKVRFHIMYSGLPAKKIDNAWRSSATLLDAWHIKFVAGEIAPSETLEMEEKAPSL